MKKILLIVLLFFSTICNAQIMREKDILEDSFFGFFTSNNANYGLGFHFAHVFFHVKISHYYEPDEIGWDYWFSHQYGLIFDVNENFEA